MTKPDGIKAALMALVGEWMEKARVIDRRVRAKAMDITDCEIEKHRALSDCADQLTALVESLEERVMGLHEIDETLNRAATDIMAMKRRYSLIRLPDEEGA